MVTHHAPPAAHRPIGQTAAVAVIALAIAGMIAVAVAARLPMAARPTVLAAPAVPAAPLELPRPAVPAAPAPPVTSLVQDGRVVAVDATSMTALGADGSARTYRITADTAAITPAGSRTGDASAAIAVDDEVSIVGVVRDGTAVATAVAVRGANRLDGPPMDAVG